MGFWRIFRVVFRKELSEFLRDRKSLFWLFAPPIILPAIALVAALFIGSQTARYITSGFPVAVINGDAAPELLAVLKRSPALIVSEIADGETVSDPNIIITLTIPDDFLKRLEADQTAIVNLTQRDNTFASTLALGAVRSEIGTYNGLVFEDRLKKAGKDSSWLTPVTINETQVLASSTSVTASEVSGSGASNGLSAIFLPLAVTSWLIGGGLGLIVDTTVGEKERQTIETMLVTPASRIGIVMGKLSVVFVASLLVMSLWMVEGMALSLLGDLGPKVMAAQNTNTDMLPLVMQSLRNLGNLVLVLVALLIPFIVLLNSLVMAFCSFASSYRESNTFLFLLQLILPAMVLLSIFSVGPDAGKGWYAAPLLGTIIAIRDLFSQTLAVDGLMLAVGSTAIYAIASLALASYVYSREWSLARGV